MSRCLDWLLKYNSKTEHDVLDVIRMIVIFWYYQFRVLWALSKPYQLWCWDQILQENLVDTMPAVVAIIATLHWAFCGPVPGPQDTQHRVVIIVTIPANAWFVMQGISLQHQQQIWYWQCRKPVLVYHKEDFNRLCHLSAQKWLKMFIYTYIYVYIYSYPKKLVGSILLDSPHPSVCVFVRRWYGFQSSGQRPTYLLCIQGNSKTGILGS